VEPPLISNIYVDYLINQVFVFQVSRCRCHLQGLVRLRRLSDLHGGHPRGGGQQLGAWPQDPRQSHPCRQGLALLPVALLCSLRIA